MSLLVLVLFLLLCALVVDGVVCLVVVVKWCCVLSV